jgi:hypothetical protein
LSPRLLDTPEHLSLYICVPLGQTPLTLSRAMSGLQAAYSET